MRSLRKSLNGNKDSIRSQISTPLPVPVVSKPASATLPPQKVIRANASYRPQAPQELSFQKGDFFHVLKDDPSSPWYEAHNPASGARGLVPRNLFEEFGKTTPPTIRGSLGGNLAPIIPGAPLISPISPTPKTPKTQVFYAIVLHDFVAERQDELDAKRGDAITVVAQSNREWFVAKPIGRLGRPGLIPATFVEIHDPTTGAAISDIDALMDRGDLPRVEDWKRAMLNYKQNSIALGVIDSPGPNTTTFQQQQPLSPDHAISVQQPSPSTGHFNDPSRPETPHVLPDGLFLSAGVVSFHFEADDYWFRINAVFQPYAEHGQNQLPPAKQLILFRVYNDFYDFQVTLLDTFPREAGRQPPHPRSLPYMPGPADSVDDALTATRRGELDIYIQELCALSKTGSRYVLESQIVRQFLAPRRGDVETDTVARPQELEELLSEDYRDERYEEEDERGLQQGIDRLNIQDEGRRSRNSDYDQERYPQPSQQNNNTYNQHPYARVDNLRTSTDGFGGQGAYGQNHQRTGSQSSFHQNGSTLSHNSRTSRSNSPAPPRTYSPQQYQYQSSQQSLSGSRNSDYANHQQQLPPRSDSYNSNGNGSNNYPPSPSSKSRTSSQALSQPGRSPNNHSINSPSISAANPQTAFVKIKIFDRIADDLIAIRVHPQVTHAELMDKIQTRLGGEVARLKYRDSITKAERGIDSNEQLTAWIEGTDKHVLYA
ncbi:hypothetical protein BDN72DRAFT_835358, partial [Pluteus cervinus]